MSVKENYWWFLINSGVVFSLPLISYLTIIPAAAAVSPGG
jgi:hypothetical protein